MEKDEFVAKSVALQMGGYSGPVAQDDAALIRALRRSSGMAIAWCPRRQQVLVIEPESDRLRPIGPVPPKDHPKTAAAFALLRSAGADFAFILDMQDRRAKRIEPEGGPTPPVFTFNRLKGDPHRILIPLHGYHDYGTGHFADAVQPDALPWDAKVPRVVWRGITGGRAAMDAQGLAEGMRVKMALRRFRDGRMTEAALRDLLLACPRYGLLERFRDDPRFDMGFVDGDGYVIAQTPLHQHLERPRMAQSAMQGYRYIAVLRGLDVGSSFYWVMNSGSLGLVMDTPFETFASGHFIPGQHYLPFRLDGSDLSAQVEWAEAHQTEAREMSLRAGEISSYLLRSDLRAKILQRILRQIAAMPRLPA